MLIPDQNLCRMMFDIFIFIYVRLLICLNLSIQLLTLLIILRIVNPNVENRVGDPSVCSDWLIPMCERRQATRLSSTVGLYGKSEHPFVGRI